MAARRGVVAGISKRKRNERNEKRRATKRMKPTTPGEAGSQHRKASMDRHGGRNEEIRLVRGDN